MSILEYKFLQCALKTLAGAHITMQRCFRTSAQHGSQLSETGILPIEKAEMVYRCPCPPDPCIPGTLTTSVLAFSAGAAFTVQSGRCKYMQNRLRFAYFFYIFFPAIPKKY